MVYGTEAYCSMKYNYEQNVIKNVTKPLEF